MMDEEMEQMKRAGVHNRQHWGMRCAAIAECGTAPQGRCEVRLAFH